MIDVLKVDIKPTNFRMGAILVKYYDSMICCDLCLYKDEKFWVRMPEVWLSKTFKRQFIFWETKEKSDEFQKEVLKKVFDMVPLTLESAIQMRTDFFAERNKMTLNKKKITLI